MRSSVLALLVAPAVALSPLQKVYHYDATDGDWVGQRVPDSVVWSMGKRRLLLETNSLRGDVALTVRTGTAAQANGQPIGECSESSGAKCIYEVDENVYGPFEAGFGTAQDQVIQQQMGCREPSKCYTEGGIDVRTAEAMCASSCGIELPRHDSDGTFYGFLNSCGGHTKEFHFHRDMVCLYNAAEETKHSPRLADVLGSTRDNNRRRLIKCADGSDAVCPDGSNPKIGEHPPCVDGPPMCDGTVMEPPSGGNQQQQNGRHPTTSSNRNGQGLYGRHEYDQEGNRMPELDACGGHYGPVPDSNEIVYHYHTQELPPFTLGCVGPNLDGSLVSVEECRGLYETCSEDDSVEIITIKDQDGTERQIPYQLDCPCWDASKKGIDGAGLNVGNLTPDRAAHIRAFVSGQFVTTRTGTIGELYEPAGVSIVPLPAVKRARSEYSSEPEPEPVDEPVDYSAAVCKDKSSYLPEHKEDPNDLSCDERAAQFQMLSTADCSTEALDQYGTTMKSKTDMLQWRYKCCGAGQSACASDPVAPAPDSKDSGSDLGSDAGDTDTDLNGRAPGEFCGKGTEWDAENNWCVATFEGAINACKRSRPGWEWTCDPPERCQK